MCQALCLMTQMCHLIFFSPHLHKVDATTVSISQMIKQRLGKISNYHVQGSGLQQACSISSEHESDTSNNQNYLISKPHIFSHWICVQSSINIKNQPNRNKNKNLPKFTKCFHNLSDRSTFNCAKIRW